MGLFLVTMTGGRVQPNHADRRTAARIMGLAFASCSLAALSGARLWGHSCPGIPITPLIISWPRTPPVTTRNPRAWRDSGTYVTGGPASSPGNPAAHWNAPTSPAGRDALIASFPPPRPLIYGSRKARGCGCVNPITNCSTWLSSVAYS
jgi:hypothetical protein